MAALDTSKCRRKERGHARPNGARAAHRMELSPGDYLFQRVSNSSDQKNSCESKPGRQRADAFAVNWECKENSVILSCTCEAVSGP